MAPTSAAQYSTSIMLSRPRFARMADASSDTAVAGVRAAGIVRFRQIAQEINRVQTAGVHYDLRDTVQKQEFERLIRRQFEGTGRLVTQNSASSTFGGGGFVAQWSPILAWSLAASAVVGMVWRQGGPDAREETAQLEGVSMGSILATLLDDAALSQLEFLSRPSTPYNPQTSQTSNPHPHVVPSLPSPTPAQPPITLSIPPAKATQLSAAHVHVNYMENKKEGQSVAAGGFGGGAKEAASDSHGSERRRKWGTWAAQLSTWFRSVLSLKKKSAGADGGSEPQMPRGSGVLAQPPRGGGRPMRAPENVTLSHMDAQSALKHYEAALATLQQQLAACKDQAAARKLSDEVASHQLYVEVLRRQPTGSARA